MRAVGCNHPLPIDNAQSLIDIEIDKPAPQGRDLLVEVKAVSVNPVDTKVRMRAAPKPAGAPKILGYDATGVVAAAGAGRNAVQAGRRGLVRRLDRAARHQQRIPSGRRAHRRAQAEDARFRRGGRAAAHLDHRLGNAVRPLRHRARAAATASRC